MADFGPDIIERLMYEGLKEFQDDLRWNGETNGIEPIPHFPQKNSFEPSSAALAIDLSRDIHGPGPGQNLGRENIDRRLANFKNALYLLFLSRMRDKMNFHLSRNGRIPATIAVNINYRVGPDSAHAGGSGGRGPKWPQNKNQKIKGNKGIDTIGITHADGIDSDLTTELTNMFLGSSYMLACGD